MDDIKLFTKNEKVQETVIHAIRIYSQDRGIKFGLENGAMLVMKNRRLHITERMEPPVQDNIITLTENKVYKHLGILEADTIKQVEMKDKIKMNTSGKVENY